MNGLQNPGEGAHKPVLCPQPPSPNEAPKEEACPDPERPPELSVLGRRPCLSLSLLPAPTNRADLHPAPPAPHEGPGRQFVNPSNSSLTSLRSFLSPVPGVACPSCAFSLKPTKSLGNSLVWNSTCQLGVLLRDVIVRRRPVLCLWRFGAEAKAANLTGRVTDTERFLLKCYRHS